jgi:hypothetical protein
MYLQTNTDAHKRRSKLLSCISWLHRYNMIKLKYDINITIEFARFRALQTYLDALI